jgi:2-polyprenyl-3-methyl-5-hydroxy-6-metoxy-1,4-benzoquinol methylase
MGSQDADMTAQAIVLPACACPVCGEASAEFWSEATWSLPFSPSLYRLADCPKCGSIFCTPRPIAEDLARFYKECYNYNWFEQHRLLKAIQGWHRWKRVQALLRRRGMKPGRILDVGCGHGLFLRWAKRSGWDAVGIDYPSSATRCAREQNGLRVIESDAIRAVEEQSAELGQFDLITVWHCLEHASDPFSLVKHLRKILKPSGKLLIAVPNGSCEGMRIKKESWVWCQEPFVHTVHFTPKSLMNLLTTADLSILSLSSRDTWDANRLFDLSAGRWIRGAVSLAHRLSGRLGFYLEEALRLGAYGVDGFKHWALGIESDPGSGAELLALSERRADASGE